MILIIEENETEIEVVLFRDRRGGQSRQIQSLNETTVMIVTLEGDADLRGGRCPCTGPPMAMGRHKGRQAKIKGNGPSRDSALQRCPGSGESDGVLGSPPPAPLPPLLPSMPLERKGSPQRRPRPS